MQGAITKRMTAIEEMAGMDVLCSDKTGTLTLNKLTVDKNMIEVYFLCINNIYFCIYLHNLVQNMKRILFDKRQLQQYLDNSLEINIYFYN